MPQKLTYTPDDPSKPAIQVERPTDEEKREGQRKDLETQDDEMLKKMGVR